MTIHSTATRISALIGAAGLALTLGAGAAQAEAMSAEEIVALHTDQCITYWGASEGTQCFTAAGVTTYDDTTYGTDTGRWEMREDEMCVAWDGEGGEFECGPITRVDAETFSDGDYQWTIN